MYKLLKEELSVIIESNDALISKLANISSLIMMEVKDLNWVGFYILKDDYLVLGPFQGEVACSKLKIGKGVCSKAVVDRKTINVSDVNSFPGHIACSKLSLSELVIPIFSNDEVVAVLDIDSFIYDRFDDNIVSVLEEVTKSIKWTSLL